MQIGTLELLLKLWPVLLFIVALVGGLSVALYRLAQNEQAFERQAEKLADLEKRMDKRLFQEGGELRYVTTTHCCQAQDSCQDRLTVVLNGINSNLDDLKKQTAQITAAIMEKALRSKGG